VLVTVASPTLQSVLSAIAQVEHGEYPDASWYCRLVIELRTAYAARLTGPPPSLWIMRPAPRI
jgi:hypothetical protein